MKEASRYRTSHLIEDQFETIFREHMFGKHNKKQIQLLPFFLSFLGSRNLTHLLSYFPGKFGIFEMNAFYSSRRYDEPFDQISAKFGVFRIRISFL